MAQRRSSHPTAAANETGRSKPEPPPAEILRLAQRRAAARATDEFQVADALRSEIEAAGWRIVDAGTRFRLERSHPPDERVGDQPRYGTHASVPSRLSEPPDARFSVQVLADEWPDDLTRFLAALRMTAPSGTQTVVVANDPTPAQAARLDAGSPDLAPIGGRAPEVVWTSGRLGHANARNIGLRRTGGSIVVLADTSVEPTADALTPLEKVLADPSVAVAGSFGFVSADMRRFRESGHEVVDAIEGSWQAFRRDDLTRFGPLDGHFAHFPSLDIWWSFTLRVGEGRAEATRIARRLDLPLVRHEHRVRTTAPKAELDRLSRRNLYRVLNRFRDRRDLLSAP